VQLTDLTPPVASRCFFAAKVDLPPPLRSVLAGGGVLFDVFYDQIGDVDFGGALDAFEAWGGIDF
jgi:hypothetical protein